MPLSLLVPRGERATISSGHIKMHPQSRTPRLWAFLFQGLQEVVQNIVRHLFALVESVHAGGAEVGPQPDARIEVLLRCLRETRIGTRHATRSGASGNREAELVRSKEVRQYPRRGTAVG